MAASIGCSLFPGGFVFQNHYPRFRRAPSGFFKDRPQSRLSVDSGLRKVSYFGTLSDYCADAVSQLGSQVLRIIPDYVPEMSSVEV